MNTPAIVGLAVVMLAGPARAEPRPQALPLRPVAPASERPPFGRTCSRGAPRIRARGVKVAGATMDVLHDCSTPGASSLAIPSGDRWFVTPGLTIEDVGAHMTEAPLHITLLRETVTPGTLHGGAAAIVHVVATWWRTICDRPDGKACAPGAETSELHTSFEVCTRVGGNGLACATIASLACPASGCKLFAVKAGIARVETLTGTEVFAIGEASD